MTQPKALMLADYFETSGSWGIYEQEAADELRRLHEVNDELLGALRKAVDTTLSDTLFVEWKALIAKATGEQA